jgi:hypothetical protein
MSHSADSRNDELWTDAELRAAVETYLHLLGLQRVGVTYSKREVARILLAGALRHRSEASIRYRMRNISSVLRYRGWPIISTYFPAQHVGSGVKSRIEAMLDSSPAATLTLSTKGLQEDVRLDTLGSGEQLRSFLIARIEDLERALADLETEFAGIGHNQPPEAIDDSQVSAKDLQFAKDEVASLREEILKPAPDIRILQEKKKTIVTLGLRLAGWIGERLTKFTDAALVTLAPIVVAKATNVLPLITDVMGALMRLLQHLPH